MSLHRSKPCRAELGYAMALCRPIVPVQVGPVSSMRAMPLADLQVVQYRPDDATSAFAVVTAIHQAASRLTSLPRPLPAPPPIPYGYLLALSQKIDVGNLAPAEQMRIIDDLRRALADEQEEGVRADIVRMLKEMRSKSWTVVPADREIESVLAAHGVTLTDPKSAEGRSPRRSDQQDPVRAAPVQEKRRNVPPPGWYPDPTRRHQWRWFDQDWTPWASDHGAVTEDPL